MRRGRQNIETIRTLCQALDKPVNVAMGLKGPTYSLSELQGVRRISVGGSMARAALGGLTRAAEEVRTSGTFTYAAEALPGTVISTFLEEP